MPADFDRCIKTPGSQKVTKSLPEGQYVHGCRLPNSKEWIWGEVKKKEGGYKAKKAGGKYKMSRS